MAKRKKWESESEGRWNSSWESVEKESVSKRNGLWKYEEQRVERIGENRGRLEAMGLTQMASSLKLNKDTEGQPGSTSSTQQDQPHFHLENPSQSPKPKVKSKSVKMKGRVSGKKQYTGGDGDDDEALRQAIALSLQHHTAQASYSCPNNLGNTSKTVKQDKGRNKNSKSFTSRLQMTEDEFIVHFFQLDEAGKGTVTKRDLERAALAHDFAWTDKELADMIHCFDSDRDGKLSLDDFRKIVVRCNMIKESESS